MEPSSTKPREEQIYLRKILYFLGFHKSLIPFTRLLFCFFWIKNQVAKSLSQEESLNEQASFSESYMHQDFKLIFLSGLIVHCHLNWLIWKERNFDLRMYSSDSEALNWLNQNHDVTSNHPRSGIKFLHWKLYKKPKEICVISITI